jgi:hypothetical protein
MDISLISEEQMKLRSELQMLKDCQVKYFWSSITATGVILGLGQSIISGNPQNIFYLAPLVIILPCWLIFYDKAATITRIVGYVRMLEYFTQTENETNYVHLGWENSLKLFRTLWVEEKEGKWINRIRNWLRDSLKGFVVLFSFKAAHRYWILNWFTFFGLSLLCLYLARELGGINNQDIYYIFFALFIIALIQTLYSLQNLINDKFSYNTSEDFWKRVLSSHEAHKYFVEKKFAR